MKPEYIQSKSSEIMKVRNTPTWDSLFVGNRGVSYYDGLVRGVYYQTELIRGVTYDE
jgi:hypothetical protein